jgi:hypothetical protein
MGDLKQRLEPLDGMEMPERWNDIRQRAPRAGLDPEPPHRQRTAVIALTVALSVATIGWVVSAVRGDSGRVITTPHRWSTAIVPDAGIKFEHPSEWFVSRVDDGSSEGGVVGLAVSNTPFELSHPDRGGRRAMHIWDMRGFPADAVLVWVGAKDGAPRPLGGPRGANADAGLPLPIEAFQPLRTYRYGGEASGLRATPNVETPDDRWPYIEVWFGPAAGEADRDSVDRVLASMRPLTQSTIEPTVAPGDGERGLYPDAVDLGLGFGICDANSITGSFGTGESTRVWFGTRTDEETLRCSPSSQRFALAVDVGGDREAEAWIDPIGRFECSLDCGLVGVVDLDGDGTDELVLMLEGGVTPQFGVVDVGPDGGPRLLGFAGDRVPQAIPANDPVRLMIGGDESYSYSVSCTVDEGMPLITQRTVAGVVDDPAAGARVASYQLRLTAAGFVVVSEVVQEGVADPPTLPDEHFLCGLELPPLG